MTQHVTGSQNTGVASKLASPPSNEKKKLFSIDSEILILEDEPLVSALIKRYVGGFQKEAPPYLNFDSSFKITSLDSGFDLLTADLSKVRVAIVDLLLPQVTGVDLIRDFRKRFPNMGIIAVSGMATEPMKRQLKELLPEELRFLEKPLRKEEFFAAFEKAMNFNQVSKLAPEQSRTSNPELTQEGDGELWTVVRASEKTGTAIQVERRGLLRKKAAA